MRHFFDDLALDLRYASRLLRRSPVFVITTVLSLAIGIGASTTIFAVANGVLFRPPAGVSEPDRLVDIGASRDRVGFNPLSYPNFVDLGARTATLSDVYATELFGSSMSFRGPEAGSDVERVSTLFVTSNYFDALGARPAAGRFFGPADGETPGASPLAVISRNFWRARFNDDPRAVGATVRLNLQPFTIVGVASEGFQGTQILEKDVWLPMNMKLSPASGGTGVIGSRAGAWLAAGARMKPGVSVAQAESEVAGIGDVLAAEYPAENRGKGLRVAPLSPIPGASAPVSVLLAVLMFIAVLVLVAACTNVAGALLSRAAARRHELALRFALGARRSRIARQLLTETAVLAALGGAAGVLFARVLTASLGSFLPSLPFRINVALSLDGGVLVFAAAVSVTAALLSGLIPAWRASRSGLLAVLKDDQHGPAGRGLLRHAFVVFQVAASIFLVAIGSLFVRALLRVAGDPGFDAPGVQLVSVDLTTAGKGPQAAFMARSLVDSVRRLPGVEHASAAELFPGGFETMGLGDVRRADAPASRSPEWDWNVVEPDYFATLRIPLVAGRDFEPADRLGTEPVVIVGEAVARHYWPSGSALGQFLLHTDGGTTSPRRIVGVVRDVRASSLIDGISTSVIYLPLQQHFRPRLTIAVRATANHPVVAAIPAIVSEMNANLSVGTVQSLENYAALGLLPQRVLGSVAGGLGIVGLLLASIGIYGVMAIAVTRRLREFGIRLALGATRGHVASLVLRQGVALVGLGSIAGLAIAGLVCTAGAELLSAFLFGVAPLDPIAFGTTTATFVLVGLLACISPVWRAIRVDAGRVLKT